MITKNPAVTSWKTITLITVLFSVSGIFGILNHEMWLDETHHFLLARDSSSFSEMFYHARYEGHPLLWNILLFAVTRFSSDPFWMQALNLLISISGAVLFLRYAPFPDAIKISIVFSYFIFYEYSIISRNYALAFLLLILVCILFRERKKHFLLFSLVLALLAQAHLFAAIITGGFMLLLFHDFFFSKERIMPLPFFAGITLVLISLTFVAVQAIPPADHFLYAYDNDAYFSFKRIGKAFSVLWKGFFPLPDFASDHPWNSNLIISFSKKLAVIPAILAWLVPAILLSKKRMALIFFYITALCMALFIYFSPLIVASRHCGFFFLLLIGALWISEYFPDRLPSANSFFVSLQRLSDKFAKPLLVGLLLIQVIAGIYMYAVDLNRPFSNAKAVSYSISQNMRQNDFIVISDHSTGPAISAYLERKVYYAENNSIGSFCKWNTKPFLISQDTLFYRISNLLDSIPSESLLLVSSKKLQPFIFSNHPGIKEFSFTPLRTFDGALIRSENYTIYEILKK